VTINLAKKALLNKETTGRKYMAADLYHAAFLSLDENFARVRKALDFVVTEKILFVSSASPWSIVARLAGEKEDTRKRDLAMAQVTSAGCPRAA